MNEYLFNDDFKDFIRALHAAKVRYILVGGYAVILYGYARTTGDMDIWVEPTAENYLKLTHAFSEFGLPLFDMTKEKFLTPNQYDVFTFGRPPVCIEILTAVKGLDFDSVFDAAAWFDVGSDLRIRVLNIEHLLQAKKAAGRPKDLDDLENLQSS